MRRSGPLLTLAAVGAVAAGAATTNVVLTAGAGPPAVDTGVAGAPAPSPAPPTGPTAPAGPVVYAGWSRDRGVSVDIRVEGGRATAYVCDNAGVESWSSGAAVPGGRTRLTGTGGDRVEYTVRDGTATGIAWADGMSREFTAGRRQDGAGPPSAPAARGGAPAPPTDDPAAPPAGGSGPGYGAGGEDGSGDGGGY